VCVCVCGAPAPLTACGATPVALVTCYEKNAYVAVIYNTGPRTWLDGRSVWNGVGPHTVGGTQIEVRENWLKRSFIICTLRQI
jgi:hypothetical protein